MKENNEDWRKAFQEADKEFTESKWFKYDDTRIKSMQGGALAPNRYDSKYQSEMGKIGGPLGGKAVAANLIAELGEEGYKKLMKSQLYDNVKDKKAFHSAGGKKTTDMRKAEAMELCRRILDRLPIGEWFGVEEYEVACNAEGKAKTYFNDVRRFHFPDVIESNGARGKYAKCIIHKKTW